MPEIKLRHIVSVSSEEKNYPADNLLKSDGYKKWRGKIGDKSLSVIIQFDKAEEIQQIDIGNENSAFIEVLVGNSTTKDDDYKVILIASSFMNPGEARNSQNGNRVRTFAKDKLSNAVSGEKWDRVKIVCTQPFNKTTAYGLSFIKFHSTPSDKTEQTKEDKPVKFGAFAVKDDSDGDSLKPGALFAKKEKQESVPLIGAAAIRAASKAADEAGPSTAVTKRPHSTEETRRHQSDRPPMKKQSTSITSIASSSHSTKSREYSPPPMKKSKTEPSKPSKEKSFSQLMEKVVFVLSGYQNPERGKIRDRALEMGATYKPDWGKGCTHLVCAFANTPKYEAVKGKGRIVTKDWIRDSYKAKKLLPWRKYRLGRAPSPGTSSESDDEPSPVKSRDRQRETPKEKHRDTPKQSTSKSRPMSDTDSGEDTEDELQRLQNKPAENGDAKNGEMKSSVYDASTDEDVSEGSDGELPELPDFFAKKVFFFYGTWEASERRKVKRYLVAYDGSIVDYMNDKVTHVLTDSTWDDNFDEALSENPNLVFVKPAWIQSCYDKQKLVPHQKFIVVPS